MNSVRSDESLDWAPILDMSDRPVELLDPTDDSVVGQCLQRVLESLEDDGVISAFGSYASDH